MVYALLIVTFGFALIWFYLPERAISLFRLTVKQRDFRPRENVNTETPGILILFFYLLNYILSTSIFLYLSFNSFIKSAANSAKESSFLYYIIAFVVALFVFRMIAIYVTGFIFNTKEEAQNQARLFINSDFLIGVFLIPILYLILFVHLNFVIYIGFLIIIILHLIRWLQTFLIAKSVSEFSILHLFMYLCTLELIPLIVLIKVFYTELI